MQLFMWFVFAVCAIALPLECRRFYRNALTSRLDWWNVVDIVMSVTMIAWVVIVMTDDACHLTQGSHDRR